jgi:2'-5' RNA ligase
MASLQPPRSDFEFGAADSPGPVARGISLWLLPEPGVREGLAHAIDALASRLGTPRFEPHLTLLGAIERPEAEVLARVRDLAAVCPPLELPVLGIDGVDDPFRCLFLRLSATPALQQLREAAEAALPGREGRPFDPHVSLVYGELSAEARSGLAREIGHWPPVVRFDVLRAQVTRGPVSAWCRLGLAPLAGR